MNDTRINHFIYRGGLFPLISKKNAFYYSNKNGLFNITYILYKDLPRH